MTTVDDGLVVRSASSSRLVRLVAGASLVATNQDWSVDL
jgi:hypothetical protein